MALYVKTKSHGDIESGFLASFTKLARLGEYAFETRDLCSLASCIAQNPRIKELKIHAYPEEVFWDVQRIYMNSFRLLEDYSSEDIGLFRRLNQGEMSLEEKSEVMDKGIILPIEVDKDKIRIGKYLIGNFHFGLMAVYLARGGWSKWQDENNKPDFSDSTISAIKKSKNPFYKGVKKFLNS